MTAIAIAKPPVPSRKSTLVDAFREAGNSRLINTVLSAVAAFGVIIGLLAALIGWLTTGGIDRNDLKAQGMRIELLTAQVGRVSDQIAAGLRPEEVNRHMSAQDGRMDAIDARMRADEEKLTRAMTLIELNSVDTHGLRSPPP